MDTRDPSSLDSAGEPSAVDGCRTHAQRAPAADAAVISPPLVIRGTSTGEDGNSYLAQPRTKVDYLTISCEEHVGAIGECISEVFSEGFAVPDLEQGPPLRHFTKSVRISVAGVPCGMIMWGGETQRGRACVELTGKGCDFVPDWKRAEQAFLSLPERSWRRADIAADFFRGELTHERVKRAHGEGKFTRGGRNPVLRQVISSDEDDGQTIYIGRRGGDALGRFYEKGKKEFRSGSEKEVRRLAVSPRGVTVTDTNLNGGESFDLASWYRAELELRAKNRPIPEEWISCRDEYFAGAYPFLQELLPEIEGRIVVRPRDIGIIAIERAFQQIRRQWGSTLFTGLAYCGGDYVTLFEKIVGAKHSRRLVEAGALLAIADK